MQGNFKRWITSILSRDVKRMTHDEQLELRLDYLVHPDKCKHRVLRFDGIQENVEGRAGIPLYTCHHPNQPHCGMTKATRPLDYTLATVRQDGKIYVMRSLTDWYGGKK